VLTSKEKYGVYESWMRTSWIGHGKVDYTAKLGYRDGEIVVIQVSEEYDNPVRMNNARCVMSACVDEQDKNMCRQIICDPLWNAVIILIGRQGVSWVRRRARSLSLWRRGIILRWILDLHQAFQLLKSGFEYLDSSQPFLIVVRAF
jgi:hypothetical protein